MAAENKQRVIEARIARRTEVARQRSWNQHPVVRVAAKSVLAVAVMYVVVGIWQAYFGADSKGVNSIFCGIGAIAIFGVFHYALEEVRSSGFVVFVVASTIVLVYLFSGMYLLPKLGTQGYFVFGVAAVAVAFRWAQSSIKAPA